MQFMNKVVLSSICRISISAVIAVLSVLLLASGLDAQIRVGILAPLNGPDAPYGVALANGVDLALSYQAKNARSDVRIFLEDTSGGEAASIRKALTLLDQNGAQLLLGEIWSSRTP